MGKIMKRLCIYVTYDRENTVDDDIGYMLGQLRGVSDRLIVVCNNGHIDKGMENIQPYADAILYRENRGYDGGAYREVLVQIQDLGDYDELVLSNDTFFGPFIPLKKIFARMEDEPCDFWGLNRRHIPLHDFTASFFLVFRGPAVPAAAKYIRDAVSVDMSRDQVLELFEQGISNGLRREGFRMGTCCDIGAVDMYRDSDYLINVLGSPVMKKRCFEMGYYIEENCRRALRYIEQETEYDISLISKTVRRRYGIVLGKDYTDISLIRPGDARGIYYSAPEGELEAFLEEHQRIYVYGNGDTARDFERLYGDRADILGYIVSEGFEEEGLIPVSQIEDKSIPVVVALSKENSREVSVKMQGFTNVFYLWRWRE